MAQYSFNCKEQLQMVEVQKIRDREMHRIRSINLIQSYFDRKNKDRIHKIKYINDIIQDLERYGPAGLIHIAVLSSIIKRPIKIWNVNGTLNKIIGRRKTGQPVDIEYHAIDSKEIGHWTLKGSKDPDNVVINLNSCLFSVIGSQIGQDPLKLHKWTVLKLKNSFQNLTKWIDKIKLEKNKMILMIGGARYTGKSAEDAEQILDSSENKNYHGRPDHIKGHARGHASGCETEKNTVEKYSKQSKSEKSGFLSKKDQNYVTHLALQTEIAQTAMKKLNDGSEREALIIPVKDLKEKIESASSKSCVEPLPKMKWWNEMGDEIFSTHTDMEKVVIVMGHHRSSRTDKNADPFILTCYPFTSSYKPKRCSKEQKKPEEQKEQENRRKLEEQKKPEEQEEQKEQRAEQEAGRAEQEEQKEQEEEKEQEDEK